MTEMSIDESKMAVDSSFSFLNLRKQHTNLKLKLLFRIENTKPLSLSKIAPLALLMIGQVQIVNKDLTATDQAQVAPYTLSRSPNSDRQLYGYTSQPEIHTLGKTAYETNT